MVRSVNIYHRALSASEVAASYVDGKQSSVWQSAGHEMYASVEISRADFTPDYDAILKLTREPISSDSIYAFPGIISTDAVDAYYTYMDVSSLRRFVKDFKESRSLLSSHFIYRLPLGSSYDAVLEDIPEGQAEGEPATRRVRVFWYMLRDMQSEGGVNTDEYIKGINAGIYRRMSIGFGGKDLQFKCKIDGSDIWDWDSEYYPGMKLEGELAEKYGPYVTYGVYNANAREGSLVYANATPGALVDRLRRMIDARKVAPVDISRLEIAFNTEFDRPGLLHRGIGTQKGNSQVDEKELIRAILNRAGAKLSKETRAKLESALTSGASVVDTLSELLEIAEEVTEDKSVSGEDRAVLTMLSDKQTRGVESLNNLFIMAEHGKRFMDEKIQEAVQARIAVMGPEYNSAAYRARLEKMAAGGDLDGVMDEIEVAKAKRSEVYYPGRRASAVPIAAENGPDDKAEVPQETDLYKIVTEKN